MELCGKGREQAAEGGDKSAHNRGDSRRLAHAQRYRHRR